MRPESKRPASPFRTAPCLFAAAVMLASVAAYANSPPPDPTRAIIAASIINVFPQGSRSVIVINRGSNAGVTTSHWVRHARGVCRPSEVFALRSKCVLDLSGRDIGTLVKLEIWPEEMVTPQQLAQWQRSPPPEPPPPPAPVRHARVPAPRLTVYRRWQDTRMTHECLGFAPDGSAAWILVGGTRDGVESPLALWRFARDGSTAVIPIAEPGDSAEGSTTRLDEIRIREKLLACHTARQERLPPDVPAAKASTSWPVLAALGPGHDVFLLVDDQHLNAARAGATDTPVELLPIRHDGPDGAKTRPETLGQVYYLPGADLFVVELHGRGSERRVGVRVAP